MCRQCYILLKFTQYMCMKKIFLYLSAFVPLYVLVTIKILIDIIFSNLSFNFLNTFTIISFTILVILGGFGANIAIKHENTPKTNIKVLSATNITEKYFLGYFSLFVLFALSFELEKVSMFVVFIIVILLIGIVYVKNDLFYINPFLNILGYNFYDLTFINIDKNNIKERGKFLYKGHIDDYQKNYIAYLSHENFSMLDNSEENISK